MQNHKGFTAESNVMTGSEYVWNSMETCQYCFLAHVTKTPRFGIVKSVQFQTQRMHFQSWQSQFNFRNVVIFRNQLNLLVKEQMDAVL